MFKNRKYKDKASDLLNPLIGLELTFSNANTRSDIGEEGISSNVAANHYRNFLQLLHEHFSKSRDFDDICFAIVTDFVNPQKNLGDKKDVSDLRINFLSKEGEVLFWINVTRDPQVIEIQTMPVCVSEFMDDYSLPARVLDQIFGETEIFCDGSVTYGGAKLSASTEGGGHINVDARSSGLLDLIDVLELIQMWEDVVPNKLVAEDAHTAARLKATRYYRTDKTFDDEKCDYSSNLITLLQPILSRKNPQLSAVCEAYWTYPQVRLFPHLIPDGSTKKDERELRVCIHNQAINIEHLWDEDANTRRIEFREFGAQKSRQDILGCWEIIEGVLWQISNIKNNFRRLGVESEDESKDSSLPPAYISLDPEKEVLQVKSSKVTNSHE